MKIILLLFMSLSVLTSFADEYKDPATNVIYTYDPTGSSAKVKSGEVYVDTDNAENVELLGFPGSPDAKESIVILERFVIDGKEYLVDRIGDYAFVPYYNLVVALWRDSYAEEYCIENQVKYIYIDGDNIDGDNIDGDNIDDNNIDDNNIDDNYIDDNDVQKRTTGPMPG